MPDPHHRDARIGRLDPRLDKFSYPATYAAGEIIVQEGERDAPTFLLISGYARAYRASRQGREQTLVHFGPGDWFNQTAAFSPHHQALASVVALQPCRTLCFPCESFPDLVRTTPALAQVMLQECALRTEQLVTLTSDLSLRSVRRRLAQFLLAQSDAPDGRHWTQEAIAAQIGTVREVVSRTLRTFVKEGVIQIQRQRITIVDRRALEREAA